jgi:hypothetical protein
VQGWQQGAGHRETWQPYQRGGILRGRQQKDEKVDRSVDMTFPASDAPAAGKPTGNEEPKSRPDREAPVISKEDIDRAQRGEGHKQK